MLECSTTASIQSLSSCLHKIATGISEHRNCCAIILGLGLVGSSSSLTARQRVYSRFLNSSPKWAVEVAPPIDSVEIEFSVDCANGVRHGCSDKSSGCERPLGGAFDPRANPTGGSFPPIAPIISNTQVPTLISPTCKSFDIKLVWLDWPRSPQTAGNVLFHNCRHNRKWNNQIAGQKMAAVSSR